MEKAKPSYYAIIPANVRYSKISPNAKLLYGEITALCSKEGYCWASNEYFAKLYGVEKNTASVWIQELKKKGFIEYEVGASNARKIKLVISDPITKNRDRYHEKRGEGYHEKSGHSITSKSNTIITFPAQSAGGYVINEMIDLFKTVNPSWQRLFARKQERQAIERMLKINGPEMLEKIIKYLPNVNGQPFAPTITKPSELEERMGKLIVFVKRQKSGLKIGVMS